MKYWPLILLTFSLTGCALWSDFESPEIAAPDAWKGQGEQAEAWPDKDWWTQFESANLTAQIEEASHTNFDLNAAVARMQQADAQARIGGAALLPTIDASADAARNRTSGSSRSASALGVASKPRITNAYSGALNASYELDFWGKNYAAAESAQALADATRFDRDTVALTVTSSVASNYFDIVATQERLAVARDNLANAERLMEAIKNRFDAGISSGLDVAQQENLVATQRAQIPPLVQRLQQAMGAQAILLGKMPESFAAPDEKLAGISLPEIKAGLPSELLHRRPDVQAAEAQLAAAHADIVAARASFFPSIGLTGSTGYESTALAALFKPDSMFFSLAGSATQVLFDNGRLSGELDVAKGRYEELLQNYRKVAFSAFSDVENALVDVQQADEGEKAQAAAEASARKAYELSQQQMEGGIADITTVLNTQRAWFAAKDALVAARLGHLQAMVGLYKALGGGWQSGSAPEIPADAGSHITL